MSNKIKCSHCGEMVNELAQKCKFCKEWLIENKQPIEYKSTSMYKNHYKIIRIKGYISSYDGEGLSYGVCFKNTEEQYIYVENVIVLGHKLTQGFIQNENQAEYLLIDIGQCKYLVSIEYDDILLADIKPIYDRLITTVNNTKRTNNIALLKSFMLILVIVGLLLFPLAYLASIGGALNSAVLINLANSIKNDKNLLKRPHGDIVYYQNFWSWFWKILPSTGCVSIITSVLVLFEIIFYSL